MNFGYRLGHLFFRAVFSVFFPTRFLHREHVPRLGPVILASNHTSYLDPPLVGAGLPRQVCALGKQSLFRLPIVGAVLRNWRVVPVDRDGGGATGLKAILERLHSDHAILLFPEGTRSDDGALLPARSGIGLTVLKSTAPVVPVRIAGAFEAWGRRALFPRPRRLTVTYGTPLDFAALRAEAADCSKSRQRELYQQVADEIMAAIAAIDPAGR